MSVVQALLSPASLLVPDWPAPARVAAVQTTRIGGAGQGAYAGFNLATHVGDDPTHVAANRAALRRYLQLPGEPHWLDQVHGTQAVHLSGDARLPADCNARDAAWTDQPAQVCVVMTADCLPVLFCDDDGRCVAAAHAGWRGLADGVLETTIAALPAAPQRLMAWLGPAIGPAAFEVGSEVRARFVADDAGSAACFAPAGAPGQYFADLYALAQRRLHQSGVARVYGGQACTLTDRERYFSFRRDRVCGRMASLIWLRP